MEQQQEGSEEMNIEEKLFEILEKIGELKADTQKTLGEIKSDVEVVKQNQERDYKALYGNGHPGALANIENLRDRVQDIEDWKDKEEERKKEAAQKKDKHVGRIIEAAGVIFSILTAIYAAFFKNSN